ncbi:MAG: hypothetical protein PHC41_01095 [Lachnospiraceae bacterium]|jgi:hypothetical protein|nr:hypothetical protein [Lachnospiraceae bacterium]MDD3614802.1 hypothetical protein [Lachnospiraceae bacterium]
MTKKGSLAFIKNGKIKAIYCHRNAQLEGFGKRLVKMCKYFTLEELNQLYDYLIPVDEDSPMTEEQKEAYKSYMPEQCWKEDLDWTTALMYTKDPTKPMMDGFPYFVDYAGFLPSWRNRFRYAINLDENTFSVSKAGLEMISQEFDEFSDTADYVDKIQACVVGSFPLDNIPDNWMEQCQDYWKEMMLVAVPYSEIAIASDKVESDPEAQHDAKAMHFYLGIKNQ